MPAIVTSEWLYAAFEAEATAELRLAMACLHDAEVRKAIIEQGTGQGRYSRLPVDYHSNLQKRIAQLRSEVSLATEQAAQSACRPIHLRPVSR